MKVFLKIIIFFLIVYVIVCAAVYYYQEKIIFYPEKIPATYSYNFGNNTEEIPIVTKDHKRLISVLFKVPEAKGVIFYLHGNGGSIKGWGEVAGLYNRLNYDVFIYQELNTGIS